ncbi:hypothetical protein CONCODRAFT_80276 [Conidiobolus coronatus NRRL 28638]|uniref:RNI-like protein n=1 Tax=Conidiobolus coronatus (strain ATCC 28846 / CBS 209.66 / NRRL 28638) TaxID=796925 RepID=A0A137NWP6_CONC2|nr:hypothetical protein CONCODRAFT_80276 [Conidiobolus coronatus NRRL 28638]|eukprot:KXN67108.1 hypothetical protein CONCODRAFT_80276 [Conidiobolus coronatus NRRL 28638]
MEHLKSVEFINVLKTIGSINSKTIIFPKMLKSLKIINHEDKYKYSGLTIYDTIDPSYINLISLTVVSNRMIQNLAFGIPSLQDVEIEEIDNLDTSKLVAFLKANPQIKKLSIRLRSYKKVILECILYSKNLEHLCINHGYWRGIEVNNHQSNYSIKYLKIYGENLPAPTNFQLISACKNLETLDIDYGCFEKLDLLKFKKKINVLKLSVNSLPRSAIKKIDTSRLFNKVHLYTVNPNGEFIYQFNFYKLILLISEAFIFELIN